MSYARGEQAARGTNAGDPLITMPLFPVESQSANLVADPSQRQEPVDSSSASIERAIANFEDLTSGTANRSSVYRQQTSFGVSSSAVWKTTLERASTYNSNFYITTSKLDQPPIPSSINS